MARGIRHQVEMATFRVGKSKSAANSVASTVGLHTLVWCGETNEFNSFSMEKVDKCY